MIVEVPTIGDNVRRRIPHQPPKHVCEVVTKLIRRFSHLDQFVGVFVPHQREGGDMPSCLWLGHVLVDRSSGFHESIQVVEHVAQLVVLPFEAIGLTETPERGVKRAPDSRITFSGSRFGTVPRWSSDGTTPGQME